MRPFFISSDAEIKSGETTDVYFLRTRQILESYGLSRKRVLMECTTGELPDRWAWGIFCGLEEALRLLEGYPVNVRAFPEGSFFRPTDLRGYRLPVLTIEGPYGDFCLLETPLLGLLCQASGIATMAARIRKVSGNKLLMGFGIRRMHPALAPMIDRATYIGGFDGVSSLIGAKCIGVKPMGTMPHALIIVFGDQVKAWKAFHATMPPDVPRIALVDTFYDEKTEALMAAEALGESLDGVRLDTPGSRRGDFATIVKEVRWELDIRGFKNVKIIASGGLNERNIPALIEAGADGFGVGTSVSNAPTIDFALDIVEVEGRPLAKRGKLGGRKDVFRCPQCLLDIVQPSSNPPPKCPRCGGNMESMLKPLLVDGKLKAPLPSIEDIRKYVLRQLERLEL